MKAGFNRLPLHALRVAAAKVEGCHGYKVEYRPEEIRECGFEI